MGLNCAVMRYLCSDFVLVLKENDKFKFPGGADQYLDQKISKLIPVMYQLCCLFLTLDVVCSSEGSTMRTSG
ncbi:hypothetical protein ARALYDRAFT_896414 [Arabidopsis lyrata subsp. lyrata]|uniref:Uncharacterized protein n=1 Tax=Arabidopsis lyrata subsp. lyrata TaxID=81972 RepID=D7L1Z7_ARALL|nr:hypothetical protein ARALYDRAFT_896414 [Arabidopsis lyrata subsp. lyrata]